MAQCLFPVLYMISLVILQFISHERSAVYISAVYIVLICIYRPLHRLSARQSYVFIILLRFRYYIETSMNYLTLTIYFRADEELALL